MNDRLEPHAASDKGPRLGADTITHHADVLVLGGGPAGCWAAITAASRGARVVLVDKGYCGTSGATAPSGTGVWYVPPDPTARDEARASREGLGGHLAERSWMDRVLDRTYRNMNDLATLGYPFPTDAQGHPIRRGLQGPEYMRMMRKRVKTAGVRILDHSPALELLVDDHGIGGAAGVQLRTGQRYRVQAGAVVIATGGCAFLSRALGCNVLTGDGGLLAAEVGADMSGMEFSNAYAIAPAHASVTKTAFYSWATFYHADGRAIAGAGSQRGRSVIAQTLLSEPVFACLDRIPAEYRACLRESQPNFFLPFDRAGIDPCTQKFEVTLRLEGTVRGTGGIRVVTESCGTTVPGLFAAGDAATRELICGGFTGGGSHNAAWAMSSGFWAGEGAALHARGLGARVDQRRPEGVGRATIDPGSVSAQPLVPDAIIRRVQDEVHPYDKNLFRTEAGMARSRDALETLWQDAQARPEQAAREVVRGREAAAMVATARWMYASAMQRTETRGMHKHHDYPTLDPAQRRRLISGGLDRVWVRPETTHEAQREKPLAESVA